MSNNWSYYDEYEYPDFPRTRGPPRVSSDTIIRAVKRPISAPLKKIPEYCGDRCHVPDISVKPMFRPFPRRDAWNDNFYHLPDLDRSNEEYEIEIIGRDNRVSLNNQVYKKETRTEASSFKKNNHTYYRLKHGDEYGVRMVNNTDNYVNALLKIDSDVMGKWRIKPRKSIIIERPSHNSRKFTFVSESSDEALEGGVRQLENIYNGLVEVVFIPLIDNSPDSKWITDMQTNSTNSTNTFENDLISNNSSYESGATVLGRDSNQKFKKDMSRYFVENRQSKMTKRIRIVIDKRTRFSSIVEREEINNSDLIPPRID
jgi:hypothetical protein